MSDPFKFISLDDLKAINSPILCVITAELVQEFAENNCGGTLNDEELRLFCGPGWDYLSQDLCEWFDETIETSRELAQHEKSVDRQVTALVAQGMSDSEIAVTLQYTEAHVSRRRQATQMPTVAPESLGGTTASALFRFVSLDYLMALESPIVGVISAELVQDFIDDNGGVPLTDDELSHFWSAGFADISYHFYDWVYETVEQCRYWAQQENLVDREMTELAVQGRSDAESAATLQLSEAHVSSRRPAPQASTVAANRPDDCEVEFIAL